MFKLFKRNKAEKPRPAEVGEAPSAEEEKPEGASAPAADSAVPADNTENNTKSAGSAEEADDGFTEWRRTRMRGGITPNGRNDIYEAYGIFGAGGEGQLVYRYYHRYPEHEKAFDMQYSRNLSFEEFNRRLLGELDRQDITTEDYRFCIENACRLTGTQGASADFLSESETETLHAFCETIDTLTDKSYIRGGGVFRCDCAGVIGDERLSIRFRKPLEHDSVGVEVAGVLSESVSGYDIGNLWISSIFNRLNEKSSSCRVTKLTSRWSLGKESVLLIAAEGFPGIDGVLLTAVGAAEDMTRFGFWSLDFFKM